MGHRDKSVPSKGTKSSDSASTEQKKKSFVRITRGKNPQKSVGRPSHEVLEPEVLDAEVVDEDSNSSVESDVIESETVEGEWLDNSESSSTSSLVSYEGVEPDEDRDADPDSSTSLVPSSVLSQYMAELRRYPLLSVEEERRLATEAYEKNSTQARQRLVTANLRLVVKIAMDYRRAYAQIMDLIQEGNAGLVQAVNRFNPYRGVKLSTYSAWWIRAYILKFLMDNKSLVRIGTTDAQRKLFFRLRSEAEKMYALTQKFDARLLAEKIGVKETEVVEMNQRLSRGDSSLDLPAYDDQSGTRQVDLVVDHDEAIDEKLAREQLLEILRSQSEALEKELSERDLFIFKNRILADEPVTLQDVGDKFGITRERARQLEAKVIRKIKEKLEEVGLNDD